MKFLNLFLKFLPIEELKTRKSSEISRWSSSLNCDGCRGVLLLILSWFIMRVHLWMWNTWFWKSIYEIDVIDQDIKSLCIVCALKWGGCLIWIGWSTIPQKNATSGFTWDSVGIHGSWFICRHAHLNDIGCVAVLSV